MPTGDAMTDLMLFVVCGFLWAIYSLLRDCLSELRKVSSRADVTNGLASVIVEHVEAINSRVEDADRKLDSIEGATTAFHDQMLRAQSRY